MMTSHAGGLPIGLGEKVRIDKGDVIGTVVGIAIYRTGVELKVAWWNQGNLVEHWVGDWRCELAK